MLWQLSSPEQQLRMTSSDWWQMLILASPLAEVIRIKFGLQRNKKEVQTMNLHLFLYIVNNLFHLLKVGVLDVLGLRATGLLLRLLLASVELVAARLACLSLLVHLL